MFIDENPFKFKSVTLPLIGSILLGVLPIVLERAMHTRLIPPEYHALIVSIVLPTLSFYGRMVYQPELHKDALKQRLLEDLKTYSDRHQDLNEPPKKRGRPKKVKSDEQNID